MKIGALSNTHALEVRAWPDSPFSALVDAVALSHEIGAVPHTRAAYGAVIEGIGVAANAAAYAGMETTTNSSVFAEPVSP